MFPAGSNMTLKKRSWPVAEIALMIGSVVVQTLAAQRPLLQSTLPTQTLVTSHLAQAGPPQSTSTSVPFLTPSAQVGDTQAPPAQMAPGAQLAAEMHPTQAPLPSQRVPPPSLHNVPAIAASW